MPINSFEDYFLSWKPKKELLKYPYSTSLAELLQNDILDGSLSAGIMLPPQRELADYLDLSLSTVTKAYKQCENRGLLFGKVGKGTFVSDINVANTVIPSSASQKIEMGMTIPFYEHNSIVVKYAQSILLKPDSHMLFEYSNPLGSQKHINVARIFFADNRLHCEASNIAIASGGQNALAIALTALFERGDNIITDVFTYPNFIGLAKLLGIKLISVESDQYGMLPDLLERACKQHTVSGIFLMPDCSNPTNISMNPTRKTEIAAIIKKYGLTLLEDGTYAFLSNQNDPPLSQMAADKFVYINSISKAICEGLRVAYMAFSPQFKNHIENAIYNINLKTSSLNVEIVTEMMQSDLYKKIITQTHASALERNLLYKAYFPDKFVPNIPAAFYHWLPLPDNCSGKMFELLCSERGVTVYGSERFLASGLNHKNAVRISISSPKTISELKKGLSVVKEAYDTILAETTSYFI
jgi:Transcriptional regulators containing a DNA-binding HTH domain and an aminotransferase domain (MocR family) and their eukaryotic orthologs